MSWLSNLTPPFLDSLLHDARFGLRILVKGRAVTAAAVLSLSLAIGACTAAFSLIDALMLRPLPVPEPHRLVAFAYQPLRTFPGVPPQVDRFSYSVLGRFRQASGGLADLFGMTVWGRFQTAVFDDRAGEAAGTPEKVRVQWISGNGLAVLGVRPVLGRLLTEADEQLDQKRAAVVLSYGFWMRRFGGNPAVLGRWLSMNGTEFQIVGVTQKNFSGVEPGYLNDLWVPLTTNVPARILLIPAHDQFAVYGRLRPGVPPEQVRQVLQAAFTNFRWELAADLLRYLSVAGVAGGGTPREEVARYVHSPLSVRSAAQGHATFLRWQFERPLWILAAVTGLVWLIACSNVANLLVARAAARGREMAMRAALGAGRLRLVQQVLVESGLVAGAACAIGLALAVWITPSIIGLMGTTEAPIYLDVHPDGRVLAFLVLAGLLTTFLFGLAPALRASSANSIDALKDAGGKGSARIGVLRPVLAAQVGFSFVVLFVAGLLLISFTKLTSVDLGFSPKNMLLFSMDNGGRGGPGLLGPRGGVGLGEKARALEGELLDRLRRFPGVRAAATSGFSLVGGAGTPIVSPPVRFPGRGPERIRPQFLAVSPGFFATMQIPLLSGREFTARDITVEVPTAVIVNETFARQFFPGEEALGKRFERMVDDNANYGAQEIVAVVRDTKYNNLREAAVPTIYQPAGGVGTAVEVRTIGNPLAMVAALRQEIQRVGPSLRVTGVTLQSTQIDETILQERMLALLAGFFGLVAVVLAAVGLYGVLSYAVVRRTKEIGIRVALGASLAAVIRMVTGDIAVTVAVGVAGGLAGGLALARLAASLLFEVKPSDFASVALPLVSLLLASAAAAIPPALRAARVDPVEALRYE
jgi:predicted permease